jgi:hypothetical protein
MELLLFGEVTDSRALCTISGHVAQQSAATRLAEDCCQSCFRSLDLAEGP